MTEARLERTGEGLEPASEGWFVLNVADARWLDGEFGPYTRFEGDDARFGQIGVNVAVLQPGRASGYYHREGAQEDFLVLSGECLLLVEGEERPLRAWVFVHCTPWTEHIFVGAGDGPCVILMAGGRAEPWQVNYPLSEFAARHNASAHTETSSPEEAY